MERLDCRLCSGRRLFEFLDLGMHPPSDRFITEAQCDEPEPKFPLKVVLCEDCGHVQLTEVVEPELLYQQDYPYESSTTRAGQRHWRELATSSVHRFGLSPEDLVVDIGSNVGVLLQMFKDHGTRCLGIDPAPNIAAIATRRGIETMVRFFGRDTAAEVRDRNGPARIITATNVFAHVDDLDDFVGGVDELMTEDGVLIIEAPYFCNLVGSLEYDTIYHEHLSYISVAPLLRFFARHDMEIFDIEQRDIHGGSLRIFVQRRATPRRVQTETVEKFIDTESDLRVHEPARLLRFASDVKANRRSVRRLVRRVRKSGKRIVGVSAPAKGMTLLNYCGLGKEDLEFITEKSALKIGRFTPGGHIPVLADDALLAAKPDYAILLAWNFAEEIMSNLADFSANGGRFVIPVPDVRVVD